ncbi:MAG: hypothetical protein ACRD18_11220 [Terriglobia bacterium]
MALCGLLERAVNEGILSTYYLKGGVAMELRFAGMVQRRKPDWPVSQRKVWRQKHRSDLPDDCG